MISTIDQSQRGDSREKGFTLVELLVSVAIVGILASIAVINLTSALDKSRQRQTMATMRNLSTALESYNADNGVLPRNGLTAQQLSDVLSPSLFNAVRTDDGWLRDLVYTTGSGSYTIESYGRDGADGPADITFSQRDQFDFDLILIDGSFRNSPETN